MTKHLLRTYFESLSRLIETGSSYCAFLERLGKEKQRIIFPNGCLITCNYQELIDIASEYSLPSSPTGMVTLLLEQPLHNPVEFFRSRVIALAIISGFGNVRVELKDSRSFIGTVEISYRGHRGKV
ncbi:MAG: hypothetical protein KME64_41365 [Scytonematopsis contorta HA4267-MV1]|jgi:hypothetical protein|nr:hypothetical protein [Scytonematopsis contorta HA4267-MV1]